MNFIYQGQIPKKILFQILKVINENKTYRYYNDSVISDRRPIVSLKLIIKPYTAGILSPTKEQDQDFKNLESLEQGILEWVNKMVQIQKEE